MFKSIRWQLSFSYAAIALLAALALGVVLLSTLRSYYSQREADYLRGNAKAVAQFMMDGDWSLPEPALQAQAQSLAFLVQARVRLLDKDGAVLADTGHPEDAHYFSVSSLPPPGAEPEKLIRALDTAPGKLMGPADAPRPVVILRTISGSQGTLLPPGIGVSELNAKSALAVTGTTRLKGTAIYSFLPGSEVATGSGRSSQAVKYALYDASNSLKGFVELSEGPAYGTQIVQSVAKGWAAASAVAVLLATVAGWLASLRISAPLQALTGVTERMAAGDLAARAGSGEQGPREVALLAASFNQMAGQVEETVLALRRFVSDAAHELRTPLTALRTNLELAATEDEAASVQLLLLRAQAQMQRLWELTDNLLELSRIEAGGSRDDREPVNLGGVIRDFAELAASQAEQAGLEFTLCLPDNELAVAGRQDRLYGLVANLVDNAIKFTPPGGTVTLGLARDGSWATLWVKDTGIGIPDEDLPQLFSRFHRGRNATGYPGNGLGLAIVKAIVQSYGGSVGAENAAPGARFVVRLPLTQGNEQTALTPGVQYS